MATGLAHIAAHDQALVLVATHSPELLDSPTASLLQVRDRDDGSATVQPLNVADLKRLDDFGLHPSDLIRRQKVFLLVEGSHDEIVLKTLLGNELAEARVHVLPIRGAGQLANTVDSHFLFEFTDAKVLALLDNLSAATVNDVWQESTRHGRDRGSGESRRAATRKAAGWREGRK
jgi:hypothetical protein